MAMADFGVMERWWGLGSFSPLRERLMACEEWKARLAGRRGREPATNDYQQATIIEINEGREREGREAKRVRDETRGERKVKMKNTHLHSPDPTSLVAEVSLRTFRFGSKKEAGSIKQ